jgi:hypothetical protein
MAKSCRKPFSPSLRWTNAKISAAVSKVSKGVQRWQHFSHLFALRLNLDQLLVFGLNLNPAIVGRVGLD